MTTHFSDGISFGPKNLGLVRGREILWQGTLGIVSFVPAELDRDGICASQTPEAAGALTLASTLMGADGILQLDVPRSISIYGTGNESGKTFTIVGWDEYGQPMTASRAGPNNTTVNTTKAFWRVASVSVSAATAAAVEIGFGDVFGLPFKPRDVPLIHKWAGTLAADAGTYVAPVTTDPALATTGDVRGTYTPSSASNGSRRLTLGLLPVNFESVSRVDWLGVKQA